MDNPRHPASRHDDVVPAGAESLENPENAASPALITPRFSAPMRAVMGFLAVVMAFCVAVLVLGGGWTNYVGAAMAASFGGMMGYFAVTGREPASNRQYILSARFMELADPARPLAPEDLAFAPRAITAAGPEVEEALRALIARGLTQGDADRAVRAVVAEQGANLTAPELIRHALARATAK